MMTSGPGTLPYEQNIQQLKGLGSAFRNLGYKDSSGNQQLGTKQLQRLASTAASLPNPAVAVTDYNPMATALRQARIQRATMTPVELAAEKVALGSSQQALSGQQVTMPTMRGPDGIMVPVPQGPFSSKAAPFTAAPAAARPSALGAVGAKPSRTPGRSGGGGGSKGGGGGGSGRSGEFGKPMQSTLAQTGGFGLPTGAGKDNPSGGGVITDAEMGSRLGKSSSNPPGSLPATSPGTLGLSPQASVANMKTTTPAKQAANATKGSGSLPGAAQGVNQKNMDIAKGLDPTGGKNFMSNPNTGMTAMNNMGGSALPGAPQAGTGAMVDKNKKKPGKGKGK